jgi:hypothetical protein
MERDMSDQQVFLRRRQVDAALVTRFASIPVANISDVMARLVAGGPRLRPMHGSGVMAGPALTVKTRPGDNLLVHKALSIASPGDVVVVDAGGDLTNAIVGELMVSDAETIYAAAQDKRRQEDQTILDIRNGQLDIRWIDEQLNRLGYRLPPGM